MLDDRIFADETREHAADHAANTYTQYTPLEAGTGLGKRILRPVNIPFDLDQSHETPCIALRLRLTIGLTLTPDHGPSPASCR